MTNDHLGGRALLTAHVLATLKVTAIIQKDSASVLSDRVLIVDDDEGPRLTLEYVLQRSFEVDTAKGVLEALDLVRAHRYSVVVMDIRMPGIDGLRGLEEVRKLDPDVGVIMLTSYTELEPAQKAIRLGANRYVTKPYKAAEIAAAVTAESERTRLRRIEADAVRLLRTRVSDLERTLKKMETDVVPFTEATQGVIHDLCSPLLATIGHAALVLEEISQLSEKYPDLLKEVTEHARIIDRCAETCYQLANSWRVSTKNHENPIKVDLGDVLHQLHTNIFFSKSQLSILAVRGAMVVGAEIEFHRIFQNLINNAFESGAEHVEVAVSRQADRIQVTVHDDGPGIPRELHDAVFRANVTSNKAGGSGRGLNIVKHLVRLQRGTITFASNEKEGTTFTVEFPGVT